MSTQYTEADLDDMTPEERAAAMESMLEADNPPAGDPDTTGEGDDQEDDAAATPDVVAVAVPDPADSAAASPEDGAAAASVAEPAAEAGQPAPAAPVFIAVAPADAEAKLDDIATKKTELRAQYDDGTLTFDQYDSQKDALAKEERTLERELDRAKLSAEMELQQRQNAWYAEATSFAKDHGYKANDVLFQVFDQQVVAVSRTKEAETMTTTQILAKAHENLVAAGIGKVQTPAQAAKTPVVGAQATKPKQPPNLALVPAAENNDTNDGEFAALARLRDAGNPDAYEDAVMKLSDGARDRYLRANG